MASLDIKEVLQQNLAGILAIPCNWDKALGGWRHDNSFLSLDTIQEELDHERVLEKKFDLQLISLYAYTS